MDLKGSSAKATGLSPSDCISDPEEKEVSDDDDDDRNHKHRRREMRSQSLERVSLEQVLTRPYRKHNRHVEGSQNFRGNDSQGSGGWKNFSAAFSDKDFSGKFNRKRPAIASTPWAPMDLNQRNRGIQAFSRDLGPGRGRGRESGSWNHRDSRLSSVEIASQIVQHGSIAPSLFAGRGLPTVSNMQSVSWNAFGLIPGIPNGGLDAHPSIGLQGTLRQPINSSLNMGMPHQRCRDFEERGFCLRGDMCPMEHGINRIVIEDVQSLSQFNLPVSLPSAHILGTPAGPGSLLTLGSSSNTLMNGKGLHCRNSKQEVEDDSLSLNGTYTGSTCAGGADLYDPDQPLWNNNCPATSSEIQALQSAKNDDTESLSGCDPSDFHNVRVCDGAVNEFSDRGAGTALGSHTASLSVWGKIGCSKNRLDVKNKTDPTKSSPEYFDNEMENNGTTSVQGIFNQGRQVLVEDADQKPTNFSVKTRNSSTQNMWKPSQKALRTLFVNGIPQKSNRKDALLSHFQKFGEVIDIYIPVNSERAFVQFSRREEAEAALKSPDAVMGNRFIKLWWANRDSIPDKGISSSSSAHETTYDVGAASVQSHPSQGYRGNDNLQCSSSKGTVIHTPDASLPASDQPKHLNGPKVPPPLQKKLESLEHLKDELRRKQEMLEQKRNDFRRQLDKLEKNATGTKVEVVTEQAVKRPRVVTGADGKVTVPKSTDSGSVSASPHTAVSADKNNSVEIVVFQSPKTNASTVLQESSSLKHHLRPLGSPYLINRYKIDNRPTGFKVIPPLPAGFASVSTLKEHFATYGDLSTVELEDMEDNGGEPDASSNCTAHITFSTHHSAQKAFTNAKCWHGHNLKFVWISSVSSNDRSGSENTLSIHKGSSDADTQAADKPISSISNETSSGDGEAEDLQTKAGLEPMRAGDESRLSSTRTSGEEEESPKGNGG